MAKGQMPRVRRARDADGAPHPVDVHVGNRVRSHRLLAGMGQTSLARALGVTFQQLQKYETGDNRISASKLKVIAETLGVPIGILFEGFERETPKLLDDEALRLLRFYYAMPERARRQFLQMVRAAAGASLSGGEGHADG